MQWLWVDTFLSMGRAENQEPKDVLGRNENADGRLRHWHSMASIYRE